MCVSCVRTYTSHDRINRYEHDIVLVNKHDGWKLSILLFKNNKLWITTKVIHGNDFCAGSVRISNLENRAQLPKTWREEVEMFSTPGERVCFAPFLFSVRCIFRLKIDPIR